MREHLNYLLSKTTLPNGTRHALMTKYASRKVEKELITCPWTEESEVENNNNIKNTNPT